MNFRKMTLALPLFAISLAAAPFAFAQSDNPSMANPSMSNPPSASESMHEAGQSAEAAGSDMGQAAKHTYHGAKTAVKDSAITAKVKTALHEDKAVGDADIHVDTVAGVVTLSGNAPSTDAAQHAEEVAQQTKGVRSVKNEISIAGQNNSMR